MPSAHTLLLFSATALALLVVPGPSVLYIAGRSAAQGRRAGVVSVLGVHTGTVVHLLAAVAGLSAVLMASAVAFTAVRWVGAAYLVVIGVRTIARARRSGEPAAAPDDPAARGARPLRRLYLDGLVVNVLNPKTALFFLAFLPQFVEPGGSPVWLQTLALGALFIALGFLSDGTYALVGAGLGRWWRSRPRAGRRAPLIEGGLLVGLGLVTVALPDARRD